MTITHPSKSQLCSLFTNPSFKYSSDSTFQQITTLSVVDLDGTVRMTHEYLHTSLAQTIILTIITSAAAQPCHPDEICSLYHPDVLLSESSLSGWYSAHVSSISSAVQNLKILQWTKITKTRPSLKSIHHPNIRRIPLCHK